MSAAARPVILDVDTGIDDALALMLAGLSPALDVRAVTCVGGNVHLEQVVQNTLQVLELIGRRDIPVAAGARQPLLESPIDASYIHGSNGVADAVLPAASRQPEGVHAVELLRRTLQDADAPVTIIALAPLTNIALFVTMYPELLPRIERIVFMGGAVGAGNATASAEFNVWHDPEAAAIVLRSGVATTMYGLEAFYAVTCSAEQIAALGAAAPGSVASTVGTLLAHLAVVTENEERIAGVGAAAIGDAGTVCAVIDPDGLTLRRAQVEVALAPGITRGQTVVDLRTGLGAGGAETHEAAGNVDVVLAVRGESFSRLFLETVTGPF
ncbi:nucleoside hydrolase [Microterricola pindariensis]|uniref:Nucleoside hydrolase n=1 Tax=Microterricola pindariensis TaxID=478010 RepID=A0ABX5AZL6_9MICO|nr:nucleoside hydrolase [Microterricola pindariensis]PPL19774.1 nucleoside hydrolase [Microterricola pindariensis]